MRWRQARAVSIQAPSSTSGRNSARVLAVVAVVPVATAGGDTTATSGGGRVRAERRITNATRKSQVRLANAPANVSKRSETSAAAKSAASAAENDKARNRRLLGRERSPASATKSDPASATKSGRVRAERRITNATRKSQTRLVNAQASVSKRSETSAATRRAASAAENDKQETEGC